MLPKLFSLLFFSIPEKKTIFADESAEACEAKRKARPIINHKT